MALVTRAISNVGSPLFAPNGTVLANVDITFILVTAAGTPTDCFDAITGERVATSSTFRTSATGEFTGALWPNDRGATVTQYLCQVNKAGIPSFIASVPSGPTTLSWIAFMANGATLTPQPLGLKDASGGYVGLSLFKINFMNALGAIMSFFTNSNTAARTYTFQDRDGTIADNNDLTLKENAANKGAANGYAPLDASAWVPLANLPALIVASAVNINSIGFAGTAGFGVGICPAIPSGFTALPGTNIPSSRQYGNYQYTDGSIMCWMPAFYYKYGTSANGLAINIARIKDMSAYASLAAANADGYALHRAFYDNGAVQLGVFVDKYKCSNNAGTASSIQFGNPLSCASTNNPFSGLTGAPSNTQGGAIAAAKTRGANFFSGSVFIRSALAMLALAHAQASSSTTWCAWYDAAGTNNFPKGCNNNALGDANDATLTFITTGNGTYPTANQTGSANVLAKTTHNGQDCGVADVNGTIWEVAIGLTSDGVNYYILNTTAQMKAITAGNTLATDGWGAVGIAANYTNLGATFGALLASSTQKVFGSATQVLDAAINGNAWNASGAGIPLVGGVGGTNAFGNDGLWDYRPNEMCPLVAGNWNYSSTAGVWALNLYYARGSSYYSIGFRAALYL